MTTSIVGPPNLHYGDIAPDEHGVLFLDTSGANPRLKVQYQDGGLGNAPVSIVDGLAATGATGQGLTTTEPSHSQRVLTPTLGDSTPFLLVATDAYFVYVGRAVAAFTPLYVELLVTSAGVGAQTAEIGLFSTPLAPNKTAQTLTKIVSTGAVDTLASTGVKRNTAAFATPVAAGTHLWVGIRVNMAVSQPTLLGISNDLAQGQILTTAGSGALTGAGPFSGSIIAASLAVGANCPYLTATLD